MNPTDDDEPGLPCVQALVAGTVALMTAWAQPDPEAKLEPDALRSLLARKIVSHLFFLREHPHLAPPLRQVMAQAHARWAALAPGPGCIDGHPPADVQLH